MSADSNVVYVPYLGTIWTCKVSSIGNTAPRECITHFQVACVWIDAEVALDALFLNRLETVLHAMPSNKDAA